MSRSNKERQKVRLIANTAEGTEIFVIDGEFRRVASALNSLDAEFAPGLYTVKFKRGGVFSQVDADLLPGSGPVKISGPEQNLRFASAAPMDQTFTSHEYHQAEAARISQIEPEPVGTGQGSQLFLFVRDIAKFGLGNPAAGMTLHDSRGRKIVDFGRCGETGNIENGSAAAWYGCNIELQPGFYRLRVPQSGGIRLEQSLLLAEDWQLQVFLVREPWIADISPEIRERSSAQGIVPDLTGGNIFMKRPGVGFDAWDPAVGLTELARQGLSTGRIPITAEDFRGMLEGKFENPMLGLFGAHLLLPLLKSEAPVSFMRPSNPEILKNNRAIQSVLGVISDGIVGPQTRQRLKQLLEEVTGNLENMLGRHPDVHAIRLELSGDSGGTAAKAIGHLPPMLLRSWETLVRADEEYRMAGSNTIITRIADRTWSGGPWLVWQVPPVATPKYHFDEEAFGKFLASVRHAAGDTASLGELLGKAGLSTVEESVLRHCLKERKNDSFQNTIKETAKILRLPVMTLHRNLAAAMAKTDRVVQHTYSTR